MKNLVLFNPSIEGGGVEKNLEMIMDHFSKNIKSKVFLITYDKILNANKKINFIKPIIKIKTKNRKLKYIICLMSLISLFFQKRDFVIFSFQANVYAILLAKILGIKVIVRANSAPSKWINTYKTFIISFFYRLADKVIVNSLEFKKEIDKKFKINSYVIYNPINSKKILKLSKIKKKVPFYDSSDKVIKILNVGRLTLQKNQIDLLKVVNELKGKIPIRLIIIGSGSEKNTLNNYIKFHKLKKFVKIIGYNKNPYIYFKKSDIFILTSVFEGLPNVLLEATLFKKLCISYKCKSGPSEILNNGKGGVLVKVGEYKKITSEIKNFHTGKSLKKYQKMIKLSYKNLVKYNFNNQLRKYEEVLINYLK